MPQNKKRVLNTLPKLSSATVDLYCKENGIDKNKFYQIYKRSGKITQERLTQLGQILAIEANYQKQINEDMDRLEKSISKHIEIVSTIQ